MQYLKQFWRQYLNSANICTVESNLKHKFIFLLLLKTEYILLTFYMLSCLKKCGSINLFIGLVIT